MKLDLRVLIRIHRAFTGAASTATHCAVFAQLIVKGKKHGVKTFVVQLRDTK
jgi:alkylation response protein AidB-like acyl-CoA dehydrogenase